MTVQSNDPRLTTTVGELVVQRPGRAIVFERHQIDYCCGGRIPLLEACAARDVQPETILHELDAIDAAASTEDTDWSQATGAALADHIEQVHHDWLREELPRLHGLVSKVARVHGEHHPELHELESVFVGFANEMFLHMVKEERVLFPAIRAMEAGQSPAMLPGGSVDGPIRMMMAEHDESGEALRRMRELTSDYSPPIDACTTYRVMLDSLKQLEQDTHLHVHKENNILFPKARAMTAHA